MLTSVRRCSPCGGEHLRRGVIPFEAAAATMHALSTAGSTDRWPGRERPGGVEEEVPGERVRRIGGRRAARRGRKSIGIPPRSSRQDTGAGGGVRREVSNILDHEKHEKSRERRGSNPLLSLSCFSWSILQLNRHGLGFAFGGQGHCPSNSSVRRTNAEQDSTASAGASLSRWASSSLRSSSPSSWPVRTYRLSQARSRQRRPYSR